MRELSCHQLCFSRPAPGGRTVGILDRIDTQFTAGSMSVISGATGAGKSTLVYLLCGLLRPTGGEIRADNAPVSRWVSAHKDLWRKDVGIVFQHSHLINDLTAFENVILPLIVRHKDMKEIRSAGLTSLERLDVGHLAGKPAGKLSGGERQKVATARALCTSPGLLLADEPTAHQDDPSAAHILELFAAHARNGNIVIVVAHDRRVLSGKMADRRFRLSGGNMDQIK